MDTSQLATKSNADIIQRLVLDGDLSKMSPDQKLSYYNQFCNALGLNPLTQPFQLITFQGKQRLYATKDCTEQLRKIHGVSITDVTATKLDDVYVVTAKAKDKEGKTDAATGAVPIANLKGADLANALMKAETKAKRRVTLSICGLGLLDESETDTMKGAQTAPVTEDTVAEVVEATKNPEEKFVIPGHWYAKLEKCQNINDLLSLYETHKETIEATAELKQLFTEAKTKLRKPVVAS